MKKIYLQKIIQHNIECYIGKADPRDLVKFAPEIEMGEEQEAQRPLKKKRVKDIANYVATNEGILPNTLTLATKGDKFTVQPCDDLKGIYFIEFPSTKEEFLEYKDTIDVMDGQHRLYSFGDLHTIGDDVRYEIGFTLYLKPTLKDRRQIFMTCNEKQENVGANLLMYFREKLGLNTQEVSEGYNLVQKLNSDLPLKGRIIMGAEPIKSGIKCKQLMEVIKQAKIHDMTVTDENGSARALTNDEKFRVIRSYLFAWENVIGFKFQSSKAKEAGPAIKISGLRYMLFLLPTIWERFLDADKNLLEFQKFCEDLLKKFMEHIGVIRENFFTSEDDKWKFRERSQIEKFANDSIKQIKALGREKGRNPFKC